MQVDLQLSDADVERIASSVVAKLAALVPQNPAPTDALIAEPAAAAECSVEPHVLRDARKRGEIAFHRIGKFVRYSREQIEAYKARSCNGGAK